MISCWSARACMYFCEAAPAANSASFFALASSACARRPAGPRRLRRGAGPDITSSMSCLMAGSSGNWPGHGALHQPSGDDQAVDLVGAFEDAVDARIAVGALGRILLHVAVAGVDLDARGPPPCPASPSPTPSGWSTPRRTLRCASGSRASAVASGVDIGQRRVDHADGAVDQRFAGVDSRGAFGQLLLDQAELGDGLAERLALLGVADGVLQSCCARRRRTPRPA